MRIPILPISIDEKICEEAEVSVAVSSTLAMRIVPVDQDGTEHPETALGVVGGEEQEDIALFLSIVRDAAITLLGDRGI